jgi:hypothetical protein
MQCLSLISTFVPQWVDTFLSDSKLLSSIVIGFLGTSATVLRNLSALTENRTVRDHVKQETARLAELVELLGKVPDSEQFGDCKKELQMQLAQSVRQLDLLRMKEQSLAQDVHSNLTFWQRLFVWFPPVSQRAWGIHALAHMFMLAGPLALLFWSRFATVHSDKFSDAVIFVVFGGLTFRAWALAERKWAIRPESRMTESGPLTEMLVLRHAVSLRMLMAQIGMWSCVFCAVESLEDILFAAVKGTDPRGGFLHFVVSLLGVGVSRAWAAAEWQYSSLQTVFRFPRMIFPLGRSVAAKAWGLATAYLAVVVGPILAFVHWTALFNKTFDDPIDRLELGFVWLASSIACNRLLNLNSHIAANRKEKKTGLIVAVGGSTPKPPGSSLFRVFFPLQSPTRKPGSHLVDEESGD